SFGKVTRNCRLTQRFALWCSSLPSFTSLHHHRDLYHWASLYCFTKLFSEMPTDSFVAFFILLLQGIAY
ncbi:hypothetical protein MTR67_031080, partial [Solanum verrucosum]